MDTKESINFMGIFLKDSNAYYNEIYEFGIKKVIECLEENEKYRQIVEDIKQYIIDWRTVEEGFCTNGNEIIDLIDWLKRKNFPKPEKKKFNINNKSDIEKDVDNLIANYMNMRFGKERLRKLIISMMALFEEDTE